MFAVRVGVLFQHLGPQQTALSGSPAQSCENGVFHPENFEGDVSLYGQTAALSLPRHGRTGGMFMDGFHLR